MKEELTIRKHWLCYAPILFLAIICILLLSFTSGKVYALGWILVGTNVLGYLTIRNYTWTAKDGEIVIRSGVLPWQRSYIKIPAAGVFGATVKRDFLGWFLDYGTITLNSIGGSSSPIKARNMKGAIKFMEHVTGGKHPFTTSSLESGV